MPRRPEYQNPSVLRDELAAILDDFSEKLLQDDLREKVLHLIPAFHKLRDLGSSLVPVEENKSAARERILQYFRKYIGMIIHGDELMVISGIQDYPRRIREFRKEYGWPIITGVTASQMAEEGELPEDFKGLKPDEYVLLEDKQDKEAAYRWNTANSIRKEKKGSKHKLLKFFRMNVGSPVSGEELSYVSNEASNWQRRVRELRTEEGWPIVTRNTGDPNLPIGHYVLLEDKQSAVHDRKIEDQHRMQVLERDHYSCVKCGWMPKEREPGNTDPRSMLELHHLRHHAKKGENTPKNLVTLCNVDHDVIHRLDPANEWTKEDFQSWLEKK